MTSAVATGERTRRRVVRTVVAVVAVAGVAALLLSGALGGSREPASALAGRLAPPLAGPTVQGGKADLADLRGKVVLVNVWASWCGPCRDELPLLARTRERLARQGLEVLGLDMSDGPVAARALLEETAATSLTSVVDPDGTQAVAWGVRGVPETFLVDRQGVVRERRIGPVTEEWVRDVVEPSLQGQQ
ncbi:MAG: TlpA family protein disulfide reductase [Actinomycetes bacterium]